MFGLPDFRKVAGLQETFHSCLIVPSRRSPVRAVLNVSWPVGGWRNCEGDATKPLYAETDRLILTGDPRIFNIFHT